MGLANLFLISMAIMVGGAAATDTPIGVGLRTFPIPLVDFTVAGTGVLDLAALVALLVALVRRSRRDPAAEKPPVAPRASGPQPMHRDESEHRFEGAEELRKLWRGTQLRIDRYHTIATAHARASFRNAQVAIIGGFLFLCVTVVVVLFIRSTVGIVAAAGLGAVAAGLAAFLSRTFIHSTESTSSRLQGYFTEPAEISRLLAARLLLSDIRDDAARERATTQLALAIINARCGAADESKAGVEGSES